MEHYQLAVIGGGPGGYTAALRGSALGLKTILVERDALGGTCLNYGCIPTKVLTNSAGLFKKIKGAEDFGIETQGLSFSFSKIQERKKYVIDKLVQGVDGLLKGAKVDVFSGEGRLVTPTKLELKRDSGEVIEVSVEKVILATGSQEVKLPLEGMDLPGVLTSKEALSLEEVPKNLTIIGGGVIGMEMASVFASFGSSVTVVELLPRILPTVDAEMSRRLTPLLRKQGINIMTKTKLEGIKERDGGLAVKVTTRKGEERLSADTVLISVGRRPDFGGQDLDSLGIEYDKTGIKVNENMETTVPGIYAVGDVASSGHLLAHVATHQGVIAAENVAGANEVYKEEAVPACIFTSPELASVGLTEEEAKEKGYKLKIGKFPFTANGKAFIQGESEGSVKIIADEELGTILGVHILGPHASDLIQEGTVAVANKVTAHNLADIIHPHPTLCEATWEAAMSISKSPIHIRK
ncbi:dihydrolipoyl dehydrogenase [Dethiobacter alkaliphilus]|uniref:Dihydrolipoyl dehydrogenase n=1 Tax=Dethiobacter alkaliphilus AHT 1 TaxID=555088 RepID=C0GKB4_DETAL|nr:dihydrolipoyl dehydrogenase [Dethiobacter alkaliphilus]EEG76229.1 dihydrolipoamide dehydrogenase [Dethiobacter alkaliphilus AHT 1]